MPHRDTAHARQRLAAALLWPESTEAQTRTNLRHVLHNLRRGLPDLVELLEISTRPVRWRPNVPPWLDVAVFEEALSHSDGQADAIAAYTGEFLAGSYYE